MATELITNGSFETGTGINPQGWTGSGPARVDRYPGLAADGNAWYTLSADSLYHGGAVSQTIATQAGKTYTLTFKSGIGWQQTTAGNFNATLNVDMLNGATLIKTTPVELSGNKSVGWGTYTVTFTATGPQTTIKFTDTSPNGQADFDVGIDKVSVQESAPANTGGAWDDVQNWPVIPIHSVVTQDGKVLTFGTNLSGGQGATMYHDLYDPVTKTHHTIDHQMHTPTDIFCSAAIIIPGTDKILISGGDARPLGSPNGPVNDSNYFSNTTHQVASSPEGEMSVSRWYNTMVSLASGQIVNIGGLGAGGVVEIFTEGEGWRKLSNATDAEVSSSWSYPRAWVGGTGEIFYYATGGGTNGVIELMALDPSGLGAIRKVGNLPFWTDETSPAIMYEAGKTLIMASNGEMWTMDITGSTPVYNKIGLASQDRNYSNMTLLADGKVLINGGSASGNTEIASIKTAAIWDPDTGLLSQTPAEMYTRVYHSTSVLLADGTVLSGGGGSAGMAENNYLNAQIYKPPYLFDASGKEAVRPVITNAPKEIEPGDAFTITVDNAAAITKLTMIKTGATTHTFNMDARSVDVTFTKGPGNTIIVDTPDNVNDMTAGSWMLFAWNDQGVPSVAPIIAVAPTLTPFEADGDGGELMTSHDHTDNLVINGSFEAFQGDLAKTSWTTFANGKVGPWEGSTGKIKMWSEGLGMVQTPDGRIVAEIEATTGTLSQKIATEAGKSYDLSFDFAARPDAVASSKMEVLWNGAVIATIVPTDATFKTYDYKVTGTGGSDVIAFRSVAGDTNTLGGLLDQVELTATPTVEPPASGGLLTNGSFEVAKGAIPDNYAILKNGDVGAWQSSTNQIEIWNNGYLGVVGTDGKNVVEIDYNNGTLSQSVKTDAGKYYGISFDYAGRPGAIASSKMEVLWNGAVIGTITPTGSTMQNYHLHVTGTGGNDVLAFRPVSGDIDNMGGLLDKVELTVSSHPPAGGLNVIEADPAGGYRVGTDAADHFKGGAGKDVFYAKSGNDIIDGAGGDYNQADLDGMIADWTFTRNSDGSIKAAHASFGTKTLTEIDGVFFYGSGKWASVASLVTEPAGSVTMIHATAAGGYWAGTTGDDHFMGGGGSDVFYARGGNDIIDGGGGDYNQLNLDGAAEDWTFTRQSDGSVKAVNATYGTKTLTEIDGVYFGGSGKWASISTLAAAPTGSVNTITGDNDGGYYVGTNGADRFIGGDGADTFVGRTGDDRYEGGAGYDQVDLSGAIAEWDFSRNADGSVTAHHATQGTDTLVDIGGVWFMDEAQWRSVDSLIA